MSLLTGTLHIIDNFESSQSEVGASTSLSNRHPSITALQAPNLVNLESKNKYKDLKMGISTIHISLLFPQVRATM